MKIRDLVTEIERLAPPAYQEDYDNAGLIVGCAEREIEACLLCFDVDEKTVDEAAERGAGLIVSHHPAIFGGLKRLTGRTPTERTVEKAIRRNVALYAAHTNLDSVAGGVSARLAEKLGLTNIRTLAPRKGLLFKLTVYTPANHAQAVRKAMFEAGAGTIGNYDECSWNVQGIGTFRAGENTNPFVGTKASMHEEAEIRTDTVVKKHELSSVLQAMVAAHPYEEPVYDVYPIENALSSVGFGAVGELPKPLPTEDFFSMLKKALDAKVIRHNRPHVAMVSRVAVCGGSGANLVGEAMAAGAEVFVTGDCKYHSFVDTEGRLILADAGHFETESFAVEIFREVISKKFPTFAVHTAGNMYNPVEYFL
ncbi:MAG: Nif3-like dinuclear metal center hexameric protein [Prevotellaceae bacterium]|jgi:dinuclear metal center YbgI/SA1388 family protein|nr:Nif3-like dinuclear metal center hexameric protein [Prevotellaceae bacterium]